MYSIDHNGILDHIYNTDPGNVLNIYKKLEIS